MPHMLMIPLFFSVSKDINDAALQPAADHLVNWAQNNGMINTNKAKELIICFNKKVNAEDIPPLHKWK